MFYFIIDQGVLWMFGDNSFNQCFGTQSLEELETTKRYIPIPQKVDFFLNNANESLKIVCFSVAANHSLFLLSNYPFFF